MACTCIGSVLGPCAACAWRGSAWVPPAPMTDPLEDIRAAMNKLPTYERCTVCNTQMLPSRYKCGTCQRCADYLDGVKDGIAAGTWKATLERDIAEVERYAVELRDEVAGIEELNPGYEDERWIGTILGRELADCEAWLVRARAALGGAK